MGSQLVLCPQCGALGDRPILREGDVVAERYRVLAELGAGGMSQVYKAQHSMMDRIVAIKMLHPGLVTSEQSILRFQQEAKAVSRLNHAAAVTVYDFGVMANGMPFLIMEYLNGKTLAQAISPSGLEWQRAVRLFIQICEGLDHAHSVGVIHRDIKPSNIVLINTNEGEQAKIVDFGIAKLAPQIGEQGLSITQSGMVVGSPLYMSPEQFIGDSVDARSDIYSLGCVMYQTVTGTAPFDGTNVMQVFKAHVDIDPTPFASLQAVRAIPPALEQIIMKALAKKKEDRFQSMKELKQALQSVLDPTVELPPSAWAPPAVPSKVTDPTIQATRDKEQTTEKSPRARTNKRHLIGSLIAVIGLIGFLAIASSSDHPEEQNTPAAHDTAKSNDSEMPNQSAVANPKSVATNHLSPTAISHAAEPRQTTATASPSQPARTPSTEPSTTQQTYGDSGPSVAPDIKPEIIERRTNNVRKEPKIVEHIHAGIHFRYPESWQYTPENKEEQVFSLWDTTASRYIGLWCPDDPTELSASDYATGAMQWAAKERDYSLESQNLDSIGTNSDIGATRMIYSYTDKDSGAQKAYAVFFRPSSSDRPYLVLMLTAPEYFEKAKPGFERFLSQIAVE